MGLRLSCLRMLIGFSWMHKEATKLLEWMLKPLTDGKKIVITGIGNHLHEGPSNKQALTVFVSHFQLRCNILNKIEKCTMGYQT